MTDTKPTAQERALFEEQGYLVVPEFLDAEHTALLVERLRATIARRRAGRGTPMQNAATRIDGDDTRIFHILDDDVAFLDLLDLPALQPYIHALLAETFHFHASDAIWEEELKPEGGPGWHMDGHDAGYRSLRPHIPHLQFKVGYYLSDMRAPDQGNLVLVPGSHRLAAEPPPAYVTGFDTFPGAVQICGGPGTMVCFHNAVWHTRGPHTRESGRRVLLYMAYERPWMVGNNEHWRYPPSFYAGLSPARRALFHGFVFDPPEERQY